MGCEDIACNVAPVRDESVSSNRRVLLNTRCRGRKGEERRDGYGHGLDEESGGRIDMMIVQHPYSTVRTNFSYSLHGLAR